MIIEENEAITKQIVPKIRSPWRRFFARSLDGYIFSVLWGIFLCMVLNINIGNRSAAENLMDIAIGLLLMIVIEPLMLKIFGTTLGKWILGLSVRGNDGQRLSYSEGLARTWVVLWQGMGFEIPIYNLIRQWKSYKACDEGETLEWEYDSTIILRDEKGWRIGAFIGASIMMFFVSFLTISMAEMPKYRGDITVAEFCKNYNKLSDYYDVDTGSYLNQEGEWVKKDNMQVVINMSGDLDEPQYVFTEENGIMTGMRFTTELHNSEVWAPGYQDEMILGIMSFVRAQKECTLFSKDIKALIQQIVSSPFEDFQFTVHGVTITCNVEYTGYMETGSIGMLWPEENAKTYYLFEFEMIKKLH